MSVLKKFLNVFLIIVGIVLIALCADLALNKTVKTSYDSLSETDRQALSQICDIINLFDEEDGNDNIWNTNYNPAQYNLIITRTYGSVKGTSYVINKDMSGNIFAQKIEMSDEYEDITVYRLAACTPAVISLYVPSNDGIVLNIGGDELYALKYTSTTVSHTGVGSFEESCVLGTFETYVQTADTPTVEITESFSLTAENIALTGLQYRIIDKLLAAEDSEAINELVAEYVTVREYQLKETPDIAKQQEVIELAEGCPQYVLYNVSDELGHGLTYFNRDKSNDIDFYSAFYYVCTGQYQSDTEEYFTELGNVYVGAALCEILDEKLAISGWSTAVDSSTEQDIVSQYSLIKKYRDKYCTRYDDKTIDDIKARYNYEEILSMARTLVVGLGGVADWEDDVETGDST